MHALVLTLFFSELEAKAANATEELVIATRALPDPAMAAIAT
nr:MAG TPA: hypothetical protein [Caudoviricetes sp.]